MCNAVVDDDSFAYLTMRKPNEGTVEFGSHAFGPNASALAKALADLVRVWDRDHRHGPGPQYTIYPAHTDDRVLDGAVVSKRHVKITIAWPAAHLRART
jgi:protein-L-isoaspartate(D-aspartate) O-methyltransferase